MNIKLPLSLIIYSISYVSVAQQNSGCSLSINSSQLQNSFNLSYTTGIAQLDQIISLDMFTLYDLYGVKANLFLFLNNDSHNAFANPSVSDSRFPNGTVLFGADLMRDEFRNSTTRQGFAIPAILAHEMGHILQMNKNCALSTMQKELQADFLAGYYLSVRSDLMKDKGIPVYTFAPEAFKSFFNKGDYEFNSPEHHGTPEQRLAAVIAGYNCDLTDIDEIYDAGKKYVQKYNNNTAGGNENSFYSKNDNSKSDNITTLNKLIDIFKKGDFSEIEGTQIMDEEPASDQHKKLVGDCKNYNSKIAFTDAVETRISSCIGGMMKSPDQITTTYFSQIVDDFNTNQDLATKKFDEWTKTIIKATGSLDFVEKKKEGNDQNMTSRKWKIAASTKIINVILYYEESPTHNLSSVRLTVGEAL